MKSRVNLFLSHCVSDSAIAQSISETLRILSLDQIRTWFSSSPNPGEGFLPGDRWFDRICDEIYSSKILMVLLTPNSVNRPWIYFESGIAQGVSECKVMPVCVGISKDDIKAPLNNYQCYQLSDYDSANLLFSNLFKVLDISYYADLMQRQVLSCISSAEHSLVIRPTLENEESHLIDSVIEDLKFHIDKRFVELVGMRGRVNHNDMVSYTINIENHLVKDVVQYFIEIKATTTVQNVLDRVYYLIDDIVNPYEYMQSWILQNKNSGARMVMYEITESVAASQVFKPNSLWKIIRLNKPYSSVKSQYYKGLGLK